MLYEASFLGIDKGIGIVPIVTKTFGELLDSSQINRTSKIC
jgi:hypothetical protein